MAHNHRAGVPRDYLPSEDVKEIRLQLERLLNSSQIRNSRRCQGLLREVTERALTGDTAGLKERSLAVTVFGRPVDYDSSHDSIVRATAAELRKKLAQYYQEPQHQSELHIELRPGCYAPEFRLTPHVPAPLVPGVFGRLGRRAAVYCAAAALLAVSTVALATILSMKYRVTDRFWAPILQSPDDVLISIGQPVVYNLRSTEAQDRIQSTPDHSSTPAPHLGQETIPLSDLVVLWDRYVALGDAVCLARIAGFLGKHGKRFRVRGEGSTSFPDLKETPAVLMGAFDNRWTLSEVGQSRFTFVKDSAHETEMVRDRDHPERTDWKLEGAWPHRDITNDYAIVSRILDANTGRQVVIAAGITEFGTMAAGEFLTDPDYWADVLPKLPKNWDKRNLQIVLRVPVVRHSAGRPRALDVYIW